MRIGRVPASTDIELFGFGGGGRIDFAQPIPSSAALLSLPFYAEAFVLAPGANAFGVVASDAAVGLIGN